MKILAIPDEISRNALITVIPCVVICIYIAFLFGYNVLCIAYCLLLVTSILYWTNTNWESMMYIDITIALIILCLNSFIVLTRFTPIFTYIWFVTLCIMAISFMVNREILIRRLYSFDIIDRTIIGDLIDKYYPITYAPLDSDERILAYKTSTQLHMIMIHLLPTIILAIGIYITCKNDISNDI